MKYSLVAVALAAAVHAQTIDDVPSCAVPCLTEAITSESDCDATDFACACENIAAIRAGATACVVEECGAETALNEVIPAVEALCAAVGTGGDDSDDGAEDTPEDTPEEEDDADDVEPTPTPEPEPEEEHTSTHVEESTTVMTFTYTSTETWPTTVPTPEPTSNGTHPDPPIPTGGAAALGSIGGIAIAGLAALAL